MFAPLCVFHSAIASFLSLSFFRSFARSFARVHTLSLSDSFSPKVSPSHFLYMSFHLLRYFFFFSRCIACLHFYVGTYVRAYLRAYECECVECTQMCRYMPLHVFVSVCVCVCVCVLCTDRN